MLILWMKSCRVPFMLKFNVKQYSPVILLTMLHEVVRALIKSPDEIRKDKILKYGRRSTTQMKHYSYTFLYCLFYLYVFCRMKPESF